MGKRSSVLSNVDDKLVSEYSDKSIKQSLTTKLDISINIAGTDFDDIGEAINYAYRCGLADSYQIKKTRDGKGGVDQDELYKILKNSHSLEHKSDFLREIAKEWFPLELHEDKKIKTVNIELNNLADFLKK